MLLNCLWQFPTTSIDATDSFYDVEGNIQAHKSDCDKESVVSDTSSTSSGVRRRIYCQSRTWKEKKKEQHKPKGAQIKWLDLSQEGKNID